MKILGLDVGTKRIGVSKADSSVKIAVPHTTIDVDGKEFDQIIHLTEIYNANHIVVGLPRNSGGEETEQSTYSREFAIRLKTLLPDAKIYLQDESLTSVEAENRLKARQKPYQKGDIDAEAATIILQDFLETLAKNDLSLLNPVELSDSTLKISKKNRKKAKKGKKSKKHILIIILIAFFFLVGGGLLGGSLWYNSALGPVSTEDLATGQEFVISDGESVSDVAANLEETGLIKNALAFRIYVKLNNFGDQLKSGKYLILPNMSIEEIVREFVEGNVMKDNVFSFTILPGETLSDIKKRLLNVGYSEEEIDKAFNTKYNHPALAGKPEDASLEGYVFGETYEFYIGETVENILKTTFDQLQLVIERNNLEQKFAERGLTLHQGIILASIIQKEVGQLSFEDKTIVAQIFYSRLEIGLNLGSDVTVTYALNQIDPERTVYTDNQSALAVDSCYNTRLYSGLPCGPISSPGEEALLAAASPADTSYLYFLTGDDGLMYYSSTEYEHNSNIIQHCSDLCNTAL
ncbi:endolytic transglycosylase MltG [Candidatus Saccharibacteria bacterium]|nr:endolytic transglycosylase MltG [Candidatus Saccharibacteria bacterium]